MSLNLPDTTCCTFLEPIFLSLIESSHQLRHSVSCDTKCLVTWNVSGSACPDTTDYNKPNAYRGTTSKIYFVKLYSL